MILDRGTFLSGLGASALAAIDPPAYAAQTVIGVCVPLSGDAKRAGERVLDGVRAACDDANRVRGPLDRFYSFRTFDDRGAVADALVNADFVAQSGEVIAVIGHLGSSATLAALRTYSTAQLPVVAPTTTDDRLTEAGYQNVFRLMPRDFDEGTVGARYLKRSGNPAKVHVLVQDGDYGADVADGFLQAARAEKIETSYEQYAWDKPNHAAVAARAIARQPAHIYLAGTAHDMGPTLAALRAGGYTGPFSAPQGFFDPETLAKYAAAADGMVVSTPMPYLPLAPTAIRILHDFETRYGRLEPLSAFGYAATQVVIAAVRRAAAPSRGTVLRTLHAGQPFETIVGPVTFGGSGDPVDPNLYFYTASKSGWAYKSQAHPGGYLLR